MSDTKPTFDEMVFSLSQIQYDTLQHETTPDPRGNPNKHLLLLDLLALLLVTDDKGDVAATMLIMGPAPRFLYCKNRPLTHGEGEYVRQVFDTARDGTKTLEDRYNAIIGKIIQNCTKKIKSRLRKILRRLRDLGKVDDFGIKDEKLLPTQELDSLRKELPYWFEDGRPISESLINWFDWLRYVSGATECEDMYKDVMHEAYSIGRHDLKSVVDFKLLQRIRKMGDYSSAVLQLLIEMDKLPISMRERITLAEIIPPPPEVRKINKTPIEILNQWQRSNGDPEVKEAEVRVQFPDMTKPLSNNNIVTCSVHYECTLVCEAMKHFSNTSGSAIVEIGVSKSLCRFCETLMKSLPHLEVRTSSRHGKHVAGWRMPPLPQEVQGRMVLYVENMISEICARVLGRRRSDSVPRSGDVPVPALSEVLKHPDKGSKYRWQPSWK